MRMIQEHDNDYENGSYLVEHVLEEAEIFCYLHQNSYYTTTLPFLEVDAFKNIFVIIHWVCPIPLKVCDPVTD